MKKNLLLLVIMTALSFSQTSIKVNLSGTWNIDLSKLKLGKAPITTIPAMILVNEFKDSIEITRIVLDSNGRRTPPTKETLQFSGLPTTSIVTNDRIKTASVRWNSNEDTLTESANYKWISNGNASPYTAVDVISLSFDEKELSLKRTIIVNNIALFSVNAFYHH